MGYNRGMKEVIQQECEACEQVITTSKASPLTQFCSECEADFMEHLNVQLKEDEIEAWAYLWAYQDSINKREVV